MDPFDLVALLDDPSRLRRRLILAMALAPRKVVLARPRRASAPAPTPEVQVTQPKKEPER